jgi:glyoxylase-like metal-dependent hydrolase (beta-lactamase superfamily II)
MFDWRDYGNGIVAFDAGYVRPILAAIHLVVSDGRVAIIDTGSNDSVPNVLAALDRIGLGPDAVDLVFLTHIHLDHAGGAGRLMSVLPRARLVVHPRGVRHMVEPAKLVAGVTAVYGEAYMQRVYGTIEPIAEDRIVPAHDGLTLLLGRRSLRCLDTPGHARHHLCLVDEQTGGIFTGDMFGLSYRELDVAGRTFVFPTTSPSQFDPLAMRQSVQRLLCLQPEAVYLTHYGQLGSVPECGVQLLRHLDAFVDIAVQARGADDRHNQIKTGLTHYLLYQLRCHGCRLSDNDLLDILATDLELNAQGLGVWLDSAAP